MKTATFVFEHMGEYMMDECLLEIGKPDDATGQEESYRKRVSDALLKAGEDTLIPMDQDDADKMIDWLVDDNTPVDTYEIFIHHDDKASGPCYTVAACKSSDIRKVYTFQFYFENPIEGNRDDSIQFCAYTEAEAVKLFEEWCLKEEGMDDIPDYEYEVKWEECDAEYYKAEYGTPEDYDEAYDSLPDEEIVY